MYAPSTPFPPKEFSETLIMSYNGYTPDDSVSVTSSFSFDEGDLSLESLEEKLGIFLSSMFGYEVIVTLDNEYTLKQKAE